MTGFFVIGDFSHFTYFYMYDKSVNMGKKGIIICSLNLKNIYCNLVYVGEKGITKKI